MAHLLRQGNMKKYSLFSIVIFFCITVQAQINLTAKYFEGTNWAVCNKDSSFFRSDTIRLIKLQVQGPDKTDESINIAGYFGGNDFITIEFKRANDLTFFTTKVDSWSIVKKKGDYSWGFSDRNKTLKLYFNSKVFAKFKPLLQSQTEIESNYVGGALTATTVIVLKRFP